MHFESYKSFYETLFKKRERKTTAEIKEFLNATDVPKLSKGQVKLCEEDVTEKDLNTPLSYKKIEIKDS